MANDSLNLPPGILGIFLFIFFFLTFYLPSLLVNEFLCYAILWIVPLLCLLSLPTMMFPSVVSESDEEVVDFMSLSLVPVGLGIIWFYFFKLIFWLIGTYLANSFFYSNDSDEAVGAQKGEIVLDVVRTSENLFPSIQIIFLALVISWVIVAIIRIYYRPRYVLRLSDINKRYEVKCHYCEKDINLGPGTSEMYECPHCSEMVRSTG